MDKKLGTSSEQLQKISDDINEKVGDFSNCLDELIASKNNFAYFSKDDRQKLLENCMKNFDEVNDLFKVMIKLFKGVKRKKLTPEEFFKALEKAKNPLD